MFNEDKRKFITDPDTKVLFPSVLVPSSYKGSPLKYSIRVIIPKSNTEEVKRLNEAVKAAYTAGADILRRNDGGLPPLDDIPTIIHDGEEKGGEGDYEDCYYLTVTSKTAPGVVDSRLEPILDVNEIRSGDTCRVSMTFRAYSKDSYKGITARLNNVQKTGTAREKETGPAPGDDFSVLDTQDGLPF